MLKNLIKKISSFNFNKLTYYSLFVIILVQFFMVSIIFFNDKKIIEELTFVQNQQNQLDGKLNALQAHLMRIETQLYRMQTK